MALGYVNIQFFGNSEKILFGIMALQTFALNSLLELFTLNSFILHFSPCFIYFTLSYIVHTKTGFRFLYLPAAIRQILYLLLVAFGLQDWFLLTICYALNLLSIVLIVHCSKILEYTTTGKYRHVGHHEFKLKGGSKTWVSVYYPCKAPEDGRIIP